jgi:hypothetical protein
MNVLAYTATYLNKSGEMAIRPETRAAMEGQRAPKGVRLAWEIGLHNPWPYPTHKNVLAQYQWAREMALEGGFDALWTVEHDVVPPANALQLLSEALNSPARTTKGTERPGVVYGVYLLRHGSWVLNAWEYVGDRNLGESLSLMPELLALARRAGQAQVCGCGWGCTFIGRETLERIPFHDDGGENPAGDLAFARDCLRANIVSVARFDVACDHYDGELRLRPFGGAMSDTVKVRATQNVVIFDGRGTKTLLSGNVYELGRVVVDDLIRAGYVEEDTKDEIRDTSGPELAVVEPPEKAVRPRGRKRTGGL